MLNLMFLFLLFFLLVSPEDFGVGLAAKVSKVCESRIEAVIKVLLHASTKLCTEPQRLLDIHRLQILPEVGNRFLVCGHILPEVIIIDVSEFLLKVCITE